MRLLDRKNIVFVWLTLISAGVVVSLTDVATSATKVTNFDEINVRRINVIEPNGRPRVVISNSEIFPGLIWGGKEYKHDGRNKGGFLFFNDEGDEVGGMTFNSRRDGENYSADSGLMFDQWKQDQTVGLTYAEQNGKRRAGLRIWDRPDTPLLPVIEAMDKMNRAKTPEEKATIRKAAEETMKAQGPFGERLFAGKIQDDSMVKLADKQGRPRLVLKVSGAGEATVEFLSETGEVVKRIGDK